MQVTFHCCHGPSCHRPRKSCLPCPPNSWTMTHNCMICISSVRFVWVFSSMYVCMYVCVYVCVHVCMYVCMSGMVWGERNFLAVRRRRCCFVVSFATVIRAFTVCSGSIRRRRRRWCPVADEMALSSHLPLLKRRKTKKVTWEHICAYSFFFAMFAVAVWTDKMESHELAAYRRSLTVYFWW